MHTEYRRTGTTCVRGARALAAALLVAITVVVPAGPAAARAAQIRPARVAPSEQSREDAYGDLPLAFEANVGQAPEGVRYVAHARGRVLLLGDAEAAFVVGGDVVQMRFGRAASVRPEAPLPGVVNYLVGNDSAKWHTNVTPS